jgi:hypothetical protein
VERCSGSPISDTSSCKRCKQHPGDSSRGCDTGNYISQTCRPGGQDIRDVSKCSPCRISSCPANRMIQGACDGMGSEDTSDCVECPNPRCNVGEYFASTCQCAPCKIQRPADCKYYFGCDGTGTTDTGICLNTNFSCINCVEGETFESKVCDALSLTPRECSVCSSVTMKTSLGVTHFVARNCTIQQDSSVSQCSKQQVHESCPPGQYWSPCTSHADGACVPCFAGTCDLGKYRTQCMPYKNAECVICNSNLTCDNSQALYRTPCTEDAPHECMACDRCQQGVSFEAQPCTKDGNTICSECTYTGACPDGFYKFSSCTLKRDTVCNPCSRYRCPEGYFESSGCNATSDRVCSPCRTSCPEGQYMASSCTSSMDAVCQYCSAPVCNVGQYRTYCGGNSDTKCAECDFKDGCPTGYFQNQSCTLITNKQCKKCFVCNGNNYMVKQCEGKCLMARRPTFFHLRNFTQYKLYTYSISWTPRG